MRKMAEKDILQTNAPVANTGKKGLLKPPLPARPKHLAKNVKKELPKPPENIMSDNMKNFINSLNLDTKDEQTGPLLQHNLSFHSDSGGFENQDISRNSVYSSSQSLSSQSITSSDVESYGYLMPVTVPSSQNETVINKEISVPQMFPPSPPVKKQDENSRFSDIIRKVILMGGMSNPSNDIKDSLDNVPTDETKNSAASVNVDKKPKTNQRQRPLPLPPDLVETDVTKMPWYKNVDRKKGEELLKNGVDGYFLVRPSSKGQNSLTLTLWFHNRLYNIPIRRRSDHLYALGTPKTHEQSFNSIQELVSNYQLEKLVLYSNGVKTGRTLLTSYPP